MSSGVILLLFFMAATVAVLIAGIVVMAKGGKVNAKYSNKLMVLRVVCQAAAIAVLFVLFAAHKK